LSIGGWIITDLRTGLDLQDVQAGRHTPKRNEGGIAITPALTMQRRRIAHIVGREEDLAFVRGDRCSDVDFMSCRDVVVVNLYKQGDLVVTGKDATSDRSRRQHLLELLVWTDRRLTG